MRKPDTERDSAITELYQLGVTQDTLAESFEITPARVWQILNKAGLTRLDREVFLSKRTAFTGVHLSEGVKMALQHEAKHEGKSLSAFVSDLLTDELKRRNITLLENEEHPSEIDVPLPLE